MQKLIISLRGGIACGIDEYGKCKEYAYDQQYNQYTIHPNGYNFSGKQIPCYEKAIDLVKFFHRRFGHFRIISWDIAISDEYLPCIIEFNLTPQGIDVHQINNGPLFGYLTENILKEIWKR